MEQDKITVTIGDCIDGMKRMNPGTVDVIIADPPYNLSKPIQGDDQDPREYETWSATWMAEAARILKDTGSMYVMCSVKYQHRLHRILEDAGLHHLNTIIWAYTGSTHAAKYQLTHSYEPILLFTKSDEYTFNMDDFRDPFGFTRFDKNNNRKGKALPDVWIDINYLRWNHPERYGFYDEKTRKGGHPTQKPLKLISRMILLSSNAGDTVLDPFLGSGTTAVASIKHGRLFVGFEVDATWEPMIKKRIASTTNTRLDQYTVTGVKSRGLQSYVVPEVDDHEL